MVAPAYLAFYNIHLYPIRNSFRLLFYAAVVAFCYQRFAARRERRMQRARALEQMPHFASRWQGARISRAA